MRRRVLAVVAMWAIAQSGAFAAEPDTKEPPVLEKAQKLPVDLPSVIIRGEDETAGPLMPGNKLSPDEPGAMAFTLPRPRTMLDLDRFDKQASDSVTPPIATASETLERPVDAYQQLRIGTSGLHRYDLGAYVGRVVAQTPEWVGSSVVAVGELDARTGASGDRLPGEWSSYRLTARASTEQATTSALEWGGDLDLRQRSSLVTSASGDSWAQGARLGARVRSGTWGATVDAEAARLGTPGSVGRDTQLASWVLGGTWVPTSPWEAHAFEVGGEAGTRATDLRQDGHLVVGLADTWSLRSDLAARMELALGHPMSAWVANPALSLTYHPASTSEITVGLRSEDWVPDADGTLFGRRLIEGNGGLLDQRVPLRVDLGLSLRLADRWHARFEGSYLQADRWVAWQIDPGGSGLWRPFNPGLAGDVGSVAQTEWQGGFSAQYAANDEAAQTFYYRLRNVSPLSEVVQEAGTSHRSTWLRGTLKLELGLAVQLQQLGPTQTGALSTQAGLQALARAGCTYQLGERWTAYARADAMPLAQSQPAPNFFAPETLIVGGVGYGF